MENKPNNTSDFWNELSDSQKKSIETSIEQLKKGKGILHDEAISQLRNFLECEQLSLAAKEIKKATEEAGIDNDELWEEARKKAWNKFKEDMLIDIGLQQIENGHTMSHEEVKEKIKKRFEKIKENKK